MSTPSCADSVVSTTHIFEKYTHRAKEKEITQRERLVPSQASTVLVENAIRMWDGRRFECKMRGAVSENVYVEEGRRETDARTRPLGTSSSKQRKRNKEKRRNTANRHRIETCRGVCRRSSLYMKRKFAQNQMED